jgi:PAS domain S-box-containing protein
MLTNQLKDLNFQSLFDAAADAMLLIDDTGHVIQTNPAALELLGYDQEIILGLEVEALMPQSYRDTHHHHRDMYSVTPKKRQMGDGGKLTVLKQNGEELEVNISLSPINAGDKRYVLTTFYVADKRVQAEKSLKISEERLRLAKQAAGLAVFDFDFIRHTAFWDARMFEFFGGDPNKPANYEQCTAATHPEDQAIRQTALDRASNPAGNGEYRAEYRIINTTNGIERWISTTGRMHFEDNHVTRFLGIVRDVSERKLLERNLQNQRIEMDSLINQHVASQTVAAIAHELNQPLAAISAYGEVALYALQNKDYNKESLNRALEGCVKQSQRAGHSLHELIAFLNKGTLVTDSFDLNDAVKEALAIAHSYGYGGFFPILQLEENMPNVLANRTHVQKVLVNLLSNGVESMRLAGVPKSAITITVRTNKDMNMSHVTVADSGPGVDAELAKRIFEPFFTTKTSGIGMGLSISRALAEANNGQLWVEPNSNSGAIFHFTLPFAA